MIKSVYLDDKKYATFMPPFMVDDMKERGIIPDYIPNNEVSLHVWGAGSWQVVWCDENKIVTYNPWTALITEKEG